MYAAILQTDGRNSDALNLLGVLCWQRKRFAEAERLIGAAIAVSRRPDYCSNLGIALKAQGRLDEAVDAYRAALALKPDYLEACVNLGNALTELGRLDAAAAAYRAALALRPDHWEALYSLGNVLKGLGRPEAAAAACRAALTLRPDSWEARSNLGIALKGLGRVDEAAAAFLGAAALRPDHPELYANLGYALLAQGRFDAAATAYRAALTLRPDYPEALWNRSLLLLRRGDLAAGWEGYEWRWTGSAQAPASGREPGREIGRPLWDGSDLAGRRLLVWREQGIGDEIMFASCIPDLAGMDAEVVLECSPKLRPLFRRSFPGVRVITRDDSPDAAPDAIDVQVPIGSLPRFRRRRLADFPAGGYLVPDPDRVAHWRRRLEALGPGPYVGVCWRGSVRTGERDLLYTRIEEWEPILRTPGAVFVNMQYDDASREVERAREAFGVELHTLPGIDMWNDLDEVAALLRAQDLLISAGTAVMSLAGGVGVPTWLLWVDNAEAWPCLGTDRLPWYPSIRLFTRTPREPWASVTQRIAAELRAALPRLGSSAA